MTLFSFLQLIIASLLGTSIGLEREFQRKDPSLRTFMLICLGSCLFGIVSVDVARAAAGADPGRVAAQIVVGIGFLGAGTIFRSRERITGLTTAALMWVTAAIGTAVGLGYIGLSVSATGIALVFMWVLGRIHRVLRAHEGDEGASESASSKANE
jgi:putative Mg2+ transporter-C (MgtC) family protein